MMASRIMQVEYMPEPDEIMGKFLSWDHGGVLVDTDRWFFVSTQECLREFGVALDQATYLQCMAVRGAFFIPFENSQPHWSANL